MYKWWSGVLKRITRQHALEELPAGSALLFALGRYCLGVRIPQSVSGACSKPFFYELFSKFSAPLRWKANFVFK
jgi:hypothetical protein